MAWGEYVLIYTYYTEVFIPPYYFQLNYEDPFHYSMYGSNQQYPADENTWPGYGPYTYVIAGATYLGQVPSNPVTTGCTYTITPPSFQAQDCTGKTANNNVATANLTPSTCLWIPSQSSCSATDQSGNIEVSGCTLSTIGDPVGQVTYFAGPGQSGQNVGTILVSFSLRLQGYSDPVVQTSNISARCP